MKKVLALMVAIMMFAAPVVFAGNMGVCDNVKSDAYVTAAGAKMARGLGNTLLGWTELFRQPIVNENKWEGAAKAPVYAIGRTVAGALEAVTSLVPKADVPQVEPACPRDIFKNEKARK